MDACVRPLACKPARTMLRHAHPSARALDLCQNGLVPASLHLDVSPARVILEQDFSENVLVQELSYTLQWQDDRLKSSPCAGSLDDLISLSFEEGLSDISRSAARTSRKRFWVPQLKDAGRSSPGYRALVEEGSFRLEQPDAAWLSGYGSMWGNLGFGSVCQSCATWVGSIELNSLQSHFKFFCEPRPLQASLSLALAHAHLKRAYDARNLVSSSDCDSAVCDGLRGRLPF